MAQLMPLPLTASCFSKIQIGFTFLVPAHPSSPGKRTVKWVCVVTNHSATYVDVWLNCQALGSVDKRLKVVTSAVKRE